MANIWRESTADVCLHIVVVNVDVEFHPFQLNITGLTATELSVAETDGLFPLFDGSCSANPGPGYRPGPGQPGYTEFSSEYQCRRVNVSSFATASDFIAPSEVRTQSATAWFHAPLRLHVDNEPLANKSATEEMLLIGCATVLCLPAYRQTFTGLVAEGARSQLELDQLTTTPILCRTAQWSWYSKQA